MMSTFAKALIPNSETSACIIFYYDGFYSFELLDNLARSELRKIPDDLSEIYVKKVGFDATCTEVNFEIAAEIACGQIGHRLCPLIFIFHSYRYILCANLARSSSSQFGMKLHLH